MKRTHQIVGLVVLAIIAWGVWYVVSQDSVIPPGSPIPIVIQDPVGSRKKLMVEIADTPEKQHQGLMFRREVTTGMLFVFDREQVLSFWMKDTYVPLDILYFNRDGTLVYTQTMVPCTEQQCTSYLSHFPAQYALEMPAGFLASQRIIGQGWRLRLPIITPTTALAED